MAIQLSTWSSEVLKIVAHTLAIILETFRVQAYTPKAIGAKVGTRKAGATVARNICSVRRVPQNRPKNCTLKV